MALNFSMETNLVAVAMFRIQHVGEMGGHVDRDPL